MKIVHLGKYYFPAAGGIETHLRTMALAQAQNGHDVEVHCFQHNPKGESEVFHDGLVKVYRYAAPVSFGQLTICPRLTKNISRSDADVFHMQVPNPSMILSLLSGRPHGVPVVVTYQSDHVNQPIRGALFSPFEWLFYTEVDRIIATSTAYRESSPLLRRFSRKVSVVPLGIPTAEWFHPTPEQRANARAIQERTNAPLWVTCSRLVPYKGIQHAILAMKDMPGKLAILGDGPERDRLTVLRDREGLRDRVEFVGFQPDLVPYLLAATALILPSVNRAEAFGIIQLEAMAAGCPVINTAIAGSGVPSVSLDGVTGFTVPVHDSPAIAAAASKLLRDEVLRARFAANGVERVRRYYSLPVCLAQVQEIYDGVVQAARSSHAHVHRLIRKSADMKTNVFLPHSEITQRRE